MTEDLPVVSLHLGTVVLGDFIPRNHRLLSTILSACAFMVKSISPVPSLTEMKNLQGHLEV